MVETEAGQAAQLVKCFLGPSAKLMGKCLASWFMSVILAQGRQGQEETQLACTTESVSSRKMRDPVSK